MRVFSLVISPLNRPSIRTVSRNESFPSNSDPWSMNAVRPPEEDGLLDVDGLELD
jgi:hypothetical protein